MIASGKMFVANSLPSFMLAMFDWNPLFHSIDQARGFAFINYNPRYSSWEYPLWVGLVLLMIGLYWRRPRSARSRRPWSPDWTMARLPGATSTMMAISISISGPAIRILRT